jgi:hypothetical protein
MLYKDHEVSQSYKVEYLQKVIATLLDEKEVLIKKLEEKEKCVGRFILMSGDEMLTHHDVPSYIYNEIIEAIKDDCDTRGLMVIDNENNGHKYNWVEFIHTWEFL